MVELTSAELKIGRPEILYPYLFFNVTKMHKRLEDLSSIFLKLKAILEIK